jgi:hypothetical protein
MNVAATPSVIDFGTRIYDRLPEKRFPTGIKRAGLMQECSDVERLCEKEKRRLG